MFLNFVGSKCLRMRMLLKYEHLAQQSPEYLLLPFHLCNLKTVRDEKERAGLCQNKKTNVMLL